MEEMFLLERRTYEILNFKIETIRRPVHKRGNVYRAICRMEGKFGVVVVD